MSESTGAIKIHQLFKEAPHLASDGLVPGFGYLTWNELKSLGTALDRAEAEKADSNLVARGWEGKVQIEQRKNEALRAELAAVRDALAGVRKDLAPIHICDVVTAGCKICDAVIRIDTALQSHRRTEEMPSADEPEHDSSITREQRHRDEQEKRLRRKYPGDRRTEEAT